MENKEKEMDIQKEMENAGMDPVAAAEIITTEPSKARKVFTYILQGLVVIATGVTGFFLGKRSGGKDNGSEDSVSPTDE